MFESQRAKPVSFSRWPREAKPVSFSRWPREAIQRATEEDRVRTIYLENIPSGWGTFDIYTEMSKFGKVLDIYVPGKLSRNGVRYGFVMFENNRDIGAVVEKINRYSNGMLCANMARGRRNEAGFAKGSQGKVAATHSQGYRNLGMSAKVRDGRSFSRAVAMDNKQVAQKRTAKGGIESVKDGSLAFNPKRECMDTLKECAFGILACDVVTYDICTKIKSLIDIAVDVKCLGGNHVLLAFESQEVMLTCLESGLLSDSRIFEWLKPWEEGDCATNRSCWLNIYGVPPQAWCEEFFSMITSRFGCFLKLQNSLVGSNDLEVAKVLVQTTFTESIERSYAAMINSRSYEIRIVEVQPSCPFEFKCPLGTQTQCSGGNQVVLSERNSYMQPIGRRVTVLGDGGVGNVSSSPDPVGIRETIKVRGNGKQVTRIEGDVAKGGNVRMQGRFSRCDKAGASGDGGRMPKSKSQASCSLYSNEDCESFAADSLPVGSPQGLLALRREVRGVL
ncbi:hypothetical protein Tsubulata_034238 [Turnera subulata]|uniref:RRM domain-containing protein n=1 Tax=Turnera subulata TaxID=218843 RepID=A0A9Q0J764_9ROSI|nr:hypothetical protein Tsubulata_034238 [Turnera subulata]